MRLDLRSSKLLASCPDGVFLGVLRGRQIRVYRAMPFVSDERLEFPGHTELARAGLVKSGDLGFSFIVEHGRIAKVFRNSVLNRQLPNACIDLATAEEVVAEISPRSARTVVYFP